MAKRINKAALDLLLVENSVLSEDHFSLSLKIANSSNPKSFTNSAQALEQKLVEHVKKLPEFPAIHKVMEQKLVELRLLMCAKDLQKK